MVNLEKLLLGVWSVAPVSQQPGIVLEQWSVMKLPNGELHCVGYSLTTGEGRASSAIASFDAAELKAVTSSGRVYQLTGKPGYDADADHTWRRWANINDAPTWVDVSQVIWQEHLKATAGR